MPRGRRATPTRKRAIGSRARDPVRVEAPSALIAAKRYARASREPAVHGPRSQAMSSEPKLQHGDVPTDGSDRELPLPEQWPTSSPQCPAGRAIECPVAFQALPALEDERGAAGQRTGYPVNGTRIEPVGTEPDLEGGDASTGGGRVWSEREDANGHRDADDGEATHAAVFATRGARPARRGAGGARLQSRGCLPR